MHFGSMQQNYIHKKVCISWCFNIFYAHIFTNVQNTKGCSITNLYKVYAAGLTGAAGQLTGLPNYKGR